MQKIKKIMFNKKGLCKFLVKAKKAGYASGDSVQEIRNNDKKIPQICALLVIKIYL